MADHPPILRPLPRRTFEVTPASTDSSAPPTPSPENTNPELLEPKLNGASPPSRTRSILNLTSSTLFGIYSPTGYEVSREEPSTPWGTGAQTPSQRMSLEGSRPPAFTNWEGQTQSRVPLRPNHGFRGFYLPLALRSVLLFSFGVAYGVIITHLHENQQLTPIQVEGIDRHSWRYMGFWGIAGVALGSLLPWFDILWEDALGKEMVKGNSNSVQRVTNSSSDSNGDERPSSRSGSGLGADWNPVVRSIGAFVGIAFAIVSHSTSSRRPSSFNR